MQDTWIIVFWNFECSLWYLNELRPDSREIMVLFVEYPTVWPVRVLSQVALSVQALKFILQLSCDGFLSNISKINVEIITLIFEMKICPALAGYEKYSKFFGYSIKKDLWTW